MQLSLYYLLLPLIRDPTQSNMKTIDCELCVGELRKGPMFRLLDSLLPANELSACATQRLERYWRAVDQAGAV